MSSYLTFFTFSLSETSSSIVKISLLDSANRRKTCSEMSLKWSGVISLRDSRPSVVESMATWREMPLMMSEFRPSGWKEFRDPFCQQKCVRYFMMRSKLELEHFWTFLMYWFQFVLGLRTTSRFNYSCLNMLGWSLFSIIEMYSRNSSSLNSLSFGEISRISLRNVIWKLFGRFCTFESSNNCFRFSSFYLVSQIS